MSIKIMSFNFPKFILLPVLIFGFIVLSAFVILIAVFPVLVSAVDSGPNFPSTATDDSSIGISAWTSPGNVSASDDSWAQTTLSALQISHYLKATNFGFSIPVGATIDGILVEWEVSRGLGGNNPKDNAARIVKGGTIGATDRSNATEWTSTDTFLSHGGSSDLWGETWTPADINATTFGAALSAIGNVSSPSFARIDAVRITVSYTVPATSSVSGTVYTDQGTTNIGSGKTVAISINGAAAAATTTTASGGTYTLSGLTVNAGDVLTVYLDGNTEKGTTVTVGSGSNLTNIDIYQNYLITRCDNSCSLTNTHLNTADNNGDSDITDIYSVSGSALTLASGKSLFIPSSKTYAPGGNVNVGLSFINQGTYTKGTETITLTDTSATVKSFAGGSGDYYNLTITAGGTGAVLVSGNNSFNDVTINAPKTITFTSGSTQTITGTFTATGSIGNLIAINSSSSGSAATLSKSSGTVSTNYLSLKDSTATGGATWNTGPNSTNLGGVTGWNFSFLSVPGGRRYAYNFIQTRFQIFKNDNVLNSANPYAPENDNGEPINVGEVFRLRFQILNNGSGEGSIARRLEFKEDGGVWKKVSTDSGNVVLANSIHFTDGTTTEARLLEPGIFLAGEGKYADAQTTQITLSANSFTEDEYALVFKNSALGHNYQFRITSSGNDLASYLFLPTINATTNELTPFNFNPQNGSVIKNKNPIITFSLNRAGQCRASLINGSFEDMTEAVNCTPVMGSFQRCALNNLGGDGIKTIYIACLGSKTYALDYHLQTNNTSILKFSGAIMFLGKLMIQ